ncbi:hypothetical protein UFOVP116_210 [uncultured Caudovirales phage]|uniref:Uncharacterized protein n=1 Tax=uncultured Caudovirales phage TaxID=2100421 RepID=A0A6J5L6G9_9CAUD|nr:hypothetical protein UFOVP116_210 [uncultured Caudovirales phage]
MEFLTITFIVVFAIAMLALITLDTTDTDDAELTRFVEEQESVISRFNEGEQHK